MAFEHNNVGLYTLEIIDKHVKVWVIGFLKQKEYCDTQTSQVE